jgi:hypothetical protein
MDIDEQVHIEETPPLKVALLEALQQQVAGEGFKLDMKMSSLTRRRGGVRDSFMVQVKTLGAPKPGGLHAEPEVGVRIDRVEDIFHLTSGFEPKYQGGTSTMGAPVAVTLGKDRLAYRFQLESYAEVYSVADQLLRVLQEAALPYFERWGSLAAIDAELNNDPGKRSVHRGLAWFRCSTGIIVARLVGRPYYDELAVIYTDVMTRDNNGFYLKRFIPLLKSLEAIESGSGLAP